MKTKRPFTTRFLTLMISILYVAVMNAQSIVEGRFVWIRTETEFTEGDYLILSGKEGTVKALNAVFEKGSCRGTSLVVQDEVIINAMNDLVWEVRKTGNGFSLKNLYGQQYLTQTEAHKSRSMGFSTKVAYFQLTAFQNGTAALRTNQRFKNDFRWNPNDSTFANFDDGDLFQQFYLFKRVDSEPQPDEPSPEPSPNPPIDDATQLTVSIGHTGYATFYAAKAVRIPQGLTAYIGRLKTSNTLSLSPLSEQIPAQTAVILRANASQTFSLPILEDALPAALDNDLHGTLEEIPHATILANESQSYYALAERNGSVGFYKVNRSIPAGKAFLLLNSGSDVQRLEFSFEDLVSALSPASTFSSATPIYDLYGRRVETTTSGYLYLQNGKKCLYP